MSTYSNEEVGEGAEDVEIAAFEIEADDESDVEITSVKDATPVPHNGPKAKKPRRV